MRTTALPRLSKQRLVSGRSYTHLSREQEEVHSGLRGLSARLVRGILYSPIIGEWDVSLALVKKKSALFAKKALLHIL